MKAALLGVAFFVLTPFMLTFGSINDWQDNMEKSFIDSLWHGLGLVSKAFGVIRREGLSYVYLFIIALSVAWFVGGGFVVASLCSWVMDLLQTWLGGIDWLPSFVTEGLGWVAAVLTYILSLFVLGFIGGTVVLCAMSPVFSHMAEKMYTSLTGARTAYDLWQFVVSVSRGVAVSLVNMVLQLAMHVVVFVISFFPVVGIAAPFLAIGVNSYFFGSSMVDYSMELHRMDIAQSFRFSRTHIGLMIGVGLPYALAICVPVLGPYIALFIAPAITVAGALAIAEVRNYNVRK